MRLANPSRETPWCCVLRRRTDCGPQPRDKDGTATWKPPIQLDEQSVLVRGNHAGNPTEVAARQEVQRLAVVQDLDRAPQPHRDVGAVHHPLLSLDQGRELDQSFGGFAGGLASAGQPCAGDVGVGEPGDVVDPVRLARVWVDGRHHLQLHSSWIARANFLPRSSFLLVK